MHRRHVPVRLRSQRGLVSLVAVLFVLSAVLGVLLQTLRISATGQVDLARQSDALAAFFLAESGLEQARGTLRNAELTLASACSAIDAEQPQLLGRGRFWLHATASRQGQPCVDDCDLCLVSSTANVGHAWRRLELLLPLTGPVGSVRGCGGSGVMPTSCPDPAIAPLYWYPRVTQQIAVPDASALVLGNLAFLRHPSGGSSDVHPSGPCSVLASDGSTQPCQPHWYAESKRTSSAEVVASRGVSVAVGPQSYLMQQELSADTLFAAVATRFGITDGVAHPVVGAYWEGKETTALYTLDTGSTSNGAACSPQDPVSTACPASTAVRLDDASTQQDSLSWCYGADTLVLGFSGKSASGASGRLNGFTFGPGAIASLPVSNGMVQFPEPDLASATHSSLYSAMHYLHNPDYMTATDVVSGAVVTGQMGSSFQATLIKDASSIAVSQLVGAPLFHGMVLDHRTLANGTQLLTCQGSRIVNGTSVACASGGEGAYDISLPVKSSDLSAQLRFETTVLHVTAAQRPYLEPGDTLYGNGVARNSQLSLCQGSQSIGGVAVPCGSGGVGAYLLSGSPVFLAPTTITSNGRVVSTQGTLPVADTWLAFRSGTGIDARNLGASLFRAQAPVVSPGGGVKLFDLAQRPDIPVSQAQLCGGICALFDHAAVRTEFQLAISQTTQWAAGLICLKGVNVASIMGLDPVNLRPRRGAIWAERLQAP